MKNLESYKVNKSLQLDEFTTIERIENAKKKLRKKRKVLSDLQNTMYAEGKYGVLICIQGMDTSGKDSLIREVFKDVNARGVNVHSFKVPTELERKHDFLWRHYLALPEKGRMGIFNRSHYENVLVTRVHPKIILKENIPSVKSVEDINDAFYHDRMERINQFENHIATNGTIVLKFFLHISKDEQKHRLLRRLNIPEKNWKFSLSDLKERKLWEEYQKYYEDAIIRTSKSNAPWFVIPADDKPTARLLVASILIEQLKKYHFAAPTLSEELKLQIEEFKAQLHNE